jgi:hypothetical protein
MAMGMAGSVWSRHGRMAGRDRLYRRCIRSMALGLEDPEKLLSRFHCCAKDHAPQGNIDFNSDPHCFVPRRQWRESSLSSTILSSVPNPNLKGYCG